ncbi:MAG: hypothetical protein AABW52_01585 [Nanoarchaeota archaeon]
MSEYEVRVIDERVREPHSETNFYNEITNLYLALGLQQKTYGLIEEKRYAFFEFNDINSAFAFSDSLVSRVDSVSVIDHKTWEPITRTVIDEIVIDDVINES